jgi:hypothetical protein
MLYSRKYFCRKKWRKIITISTKNAADEKALLHEKKIEEFLSQIGRMAKLDRFWLFVKDKERITTLVIRELWVFIPRGQLIPNPDETDPP